VNKRLWLAILLLSGLAILAYPLTTGQGRRESIIMRSWGSYQQMSLDNLIAHSDLIAIGTVDVIHPARWNTPDGLLPEEITARSITPDLLIFTDVEFSSGQILKGPSDTKAARIRALGGSVGQDQMIANDVALEINKSYLLFLVLDRAGTTSNIIPGHYWVTGGYQGLYEISDGKAISFRDDWQLEDLVAYIQDSLSQIP